MKNLCLLLLIFVSVSCKEEKEKNTTHYSTKEYNQLPPIPSKMELFGETIDLRDEDIRERLDNELIVNAYLHSSTTLIIKRANRHFPEIDQLLKEQQIPSDFKYLCVIESNLTQAISPAGARGFWQFMPETAKEYNLLINTEIDERLNVQKSTLAACAYLKKSHAEFKNWILAAASYNRGMGGVRSDMKSQYTNNYFDTEMNNETGRYVFKIMTMKLILENPKAYGFNIKAADLYPIRNTKTITINTPIPDLAWWAKNNNVNLKIIRKLNPWLLTNSLTIKPINYVITLPKPPYKLKNYVEYKQ
jgi:membrane-bound lytic murein transglycosylase D